MLESIPYSVVVIVAVALSALCVLAALLRRFGRIVPERGAVPLLVLAVAAVLYGGTKPGSGTNAPPLLSGMFAPRGGSVTAFTDAQLAAGFALAEALTDETHDFAPTPGAVIHEPWRRRGAHEDFISLPATNWSFPWGTATVSRVTVLSSGEIGFDGWYSVSNRIAPFAASLGIVPEANWPLLGGGATNSLFWHSATSDSLTLTWLNALLDRDTNFPVSFQASLHRSGDFIFRYDSNASMLASNASIEAFIDGFGEIDTNGPATTLRWASLAGLANGADFDGDGLSDADEVLLHFTNPRLADSDLDGCSDWREIHYGTDPFDPDEDGDGVPDGVAPAAWYGNALWATNATDGVIVTVTLNHAIPVGARAAFMLDDLSIPLRAPASWCFAFEPGVPHDYRLFVSDGATADLSITAADPGQAHGPLLRGAEATPLWAEGDGGVFDGPSPGGAGKAAVPRLEFTYHVAGAMAHQRGGSLCLHGGDRVTFEANVLPAEIGAEWELENLREIDGALALYVPDDGMDHAGRATLAGGTLREGGLSFDFAAHRFEMARTGPFCAVCGCYEPVDAALGIFPRTLTLKYDDVATLSIGHAGSPGVEYADVRFEVRQPGYTGWLAIPGNTWKARIAGTFQVRGFATADGREVEVGPENVWVRFPSEAEMMAEPAVQAHAAELWAQTLLLCTATSRRELGCWIRLDTATGTYSFTDTLPGPEALNDQGSVIDFGTPPPDIPLHPNLQHGSAVYTASAFHTHTPTTYRSPGDPRIVGPSGVDGHNSQTQQIPSIVYDYVESPALTGVIPMGHPKDAPVQLYQTGVCPRRINP